MFFSIFLWSNSCLCFILFYNSALVFGLSPFHFVVYSCIDYAGCQIISNLIPHFTVMTRQTCFWFLLNTYYTASACYCLCQCRDTTKPLLLQQTITFLQECIHRCLWDPSAICFLESPWGPLSTVTLPTKRLVDFGENATANVSSLSSKYHEINFFKPIFR